MENRLIKIEPFNYRSSWNKDKASSIRLKGRWLTDAGFKPGSHVSVTVKPNQLVITKGQP